LAEWLSWAKSPEKESLTTRYQPYKTNYEAITVFNVSAKNVARNRGAEKPTQLLSLNVYGDYSEEAYASVLKSGILIVRCQNWLSNSNEDWKISYQDRVGGSRHIRLPCGAWATMGSTVAGEIGEQSRVVHSG
jgi:hypothetical protein